MRTSTRNRVLSILSILLILTVWQSAAFLAGKELILPGPVPVVRSLLAYVGRADFWRHLGATFQRGAVGFILAYLAGIGWGLIAGLSRTFDTVFRPYLVALRSTPTMAVILLALIWFPSNAAAVFVVFLLVFPLVTQNVIEGVRSVDPKLLDMARLYRVNRRQILARLYYPAVLPYLAAGAASGLGLTWKVIISAEVLAGPRWGLGALMDGARVFLQTPAVLALAVVAVLLGLFFDRALENMVRKKFFLWRELNS